MLQSKLNIKIIYKQHLRIGKNRLYSSLNEVTLNDVESFYINNTYT